MANVNLREVSKRVNDILAYLDKKVAEMYGADELPEEGARLVTVRFDAEDQIDVIAADLLESRGIATWVTERGVGKSFEVEANAALRKDGAGGQTKATLALAARIDALEGVLDQLVSQNERLLEAMTAAPAKALPAAKKPKAEKAKKGGRRG